jgi:import inner membrane translocase subunit TIM44
MSYNHRLQQQQESLADLHLARRQDPLLQLRYTFFYQQQQQQQSRWQSTTAAGDPSNPEKKDKDDNDNKGDDDKTEDKSSGTDSLRDTIHRLKQERGETTTSGESSARSSTDVFRNFAEFYAWTQTEVNKAWKDLLGEVFNPKEINKRLKTARPDASATTTEEEDEKYTGTVAVMVIDESEHLTAWERMQRRLSEAPLIHAILEKTSEIYDKSGAKKAKQKIDDLAEDAREAWETSQNPWVYRVSNVYETVTSLNPESMAIRELQVLDPEFNLDRWHEDLVDYTLPQLMRWFLEGKISLLKPWLGESVFKRMAAEIAARKKEKVQIDTHVLAILRSNIIAIEVCVCV